MAYWYSKSAITSHFCRSNASMSGNVAFDLSLELPPRGSRRMGRDLHRQLRAAIVGGRLQSGRRWPSTRELARTLGVSRNTVVNAYDLLLAEGYVGAVGRGGTRVASFLSVPAREPAAADGLDPRLNPIWRAPYRVIPIGLPRRCHYDFTVGVPDMALFPFALWRRLSARALRAASKGRLGYGEPQGVRAL